MLRKWEQKIKVPSNNQDVEITILDAAPRSKGGLAGGWRAEAGQPVEAGIHGFWPEYRNTFQVMTDRILNQVLSRFTPNFQPNRNRNQLMTLDQISALGLLGALIFSSQRLSPTSDSTRNWPCRSCMSYR
jgi:hypothetical protein